MKMKIEFLTLLIFCWTVSQCSANEGKEERDADESENDSGKGAKEPNWCDLKCNDGSNNVVCVNKITDSFDLNCYNYLVETTPELRSEILHWHNEFRNDAVWGKSGLPTATNMRQLDWDEDLELSANIWLLLCVINLAPCRRTPNFDVVGQNFNIVGTRRSSADVASVLKSCLNPWASEESRATYETIANFSLKGEKKWTANFVNLVAADTNSIGCGVAKYQQGSYHFRSIVCNYAPGLVEQFPVYREGLPCQGCPFNWTCRNESLYPYLCSHDGQPLGRAPPIVNNADTRTMDILDISLLNIGAPLCSTVRNVVMEILGSTCIYLGTI